MGDEELAWLLAGIDLGILTNEIIIALLEK